MASLASVASVREHLVEELNELLHAEDVLIERKKESRRELKAAFLACNAQAATAADREPARKSGKGRSKTRSR